MDRTGLVTVPARAWRHYRRHGVQSLLHRARLTFRYGFWGLEPLPDQLPDGVVPSDPRGIFAAVDAPWDGIAEAGPSLPISGWACSNDAVHSIEVYLDGALVSRVTPTIHRPDVAKRFSRVEQAGRSGFSMDLSLEGVAMGPHQLVLAARDTADRCRVFARSFERISSDDAYHAFYRASLPIRRDLARLRRRSRGASLPRIALWIAPEGEGDLRATLRSVATQDYPAWRCTVLVLEGTSGGDVRSLLDAAVPPGVRGRFRVRSRPLPADQGVPAGTYHGFLRAGEILAPNALSVFGLRIAATDPIVAYSDHDSVDSGGRHVRPFFIPDWSPDHLLARDYIGGFFLIRQGVNLQTALANVLPADRPAWRYELLLDLGEKPGPVTHIPRVLWSAPAHATGADTESAGKRGAVAAELERRQASAEVTETEVPGIRRIRWASGGQRKVSIVIPTTGKLDYLVPCVESITSGTSYPRYELTFLDNGRGKHPEGIEYLRSLDLKVLERHEPFNWAKLSNDGARASDGDLLLFLNDDVEAIDHDWLTELVSQAERPGVGAVGPLLLYPGGAIQHAGVFLVDHGGGARHFFQGQDPGSPIYLDLQHMAREVSANTGACLIVDREKFEEVGGFDERFAVSGNDVDFCLRLMERGYRNVWTPHSRLLHHESVSRAGAKVDLDEDLMRQRWGYLLRSGDPYFNANLAQDRSDCSFVLARADTNATRHA